MTKAKKNCVHQSFKADVAVGRLFHNGEASETEKPDAYTAEIVISCADCGEKFQFVGLPCGVSPGTPMASWDGTEARLPVCPVSETPDVSGPGFTMTHQRFNQGKGN